jgi:ribosomal protein RSM22 (predicted rRNA methylase)
MAFKGVTPNDPLTTYLVKHLLCREAEIQYAAGNIAREFLDPSIKTLRKISERYTEHTVGKLLTQPINTEQEAVAYALYYLPVNFAKISRLLSYCSLPKDYSVLDYGSGPGTGSLAALFHSIRPSRIVCIDHSSQMRKVAQRLVSPQESVHPVLTTEYYSKLPEIPHKESFDLIIAANVLAELSVEEGTGLIESLLKKIPPKGYLLLIEPGQCAHTRRLMTIRDTICSERSGIVPIFPCCRKDICPMLRKSDSDWCHGTIQWERPRLIQQFDDVLEFNKHRLSYSAFIFQREGSLPTGYRVIERGRRDRKGIQATLCGENFYGPVLLKPKTRSKENRALERSEVFDRLELSVPAKTDLPEDTKVKSLD